MGLRQFAGGVTGQSVGSGWGIFALRMLAALILLGLALWFGKGSDIYWTELGALERILRLAIVVAGGIAVYFATLFALGFRLRDLRRTAAT